jgi:hypothetical protein
MGRKSKIKSTPFLNSFCVVLLRHYVLIRKFFVPRKSSRLNRLADSIGVYITNNYLFVTYISAFLISIIVHNSLKVYSI